jgi:hypothetical protein
MIHGKTLKVLHYGEDEKDNRDVTLSPISIKMVQAEIGVTMRQGRPVKAVNVIFLEGDSVDLNLTDYDLEKLESVVGFYDLDPIV